jgi:hypothetical protein
VTGEGWQVLQDSMSNVASRISKYGAQFASQISGLSLSPLCAGIDLDG